MPGNVLKKGMETNLIVALAITIVVLVILLVFTGRQTIFAGQRAEFMQCKESVRLSAENKEAWAAADVDWADIINCPPNYLTLNTDDKDFNKKFVKEIVDCWDKMHEGKLDLFAQEDAVFCVVCSVFEEFEGREGISGQEIEYYMKNTMRPGTETTIWNYLVGEDYKFSELDKSKKYAVIYVHGKTAYEWSTEYQTWQLTQQGVNWDVLKGAVAWVAGWDRAADWDARWAVTEYSEDALKNLKCQVIEQ
jgi:hypothetical protein